jgi:hypothetical protein
MEGVGSLSVRYDSETKEFEINNPMIIRYHGSHGEYYEYNGIYYDIHFPVDWACQPPEESLYIKEEYLDEFGPEKCLNCFHYGYYNGVFIGYCANCASILKHTRGNGMIDVGCEVTAAHVLAFSLPQQIDDDNSMWNIYMQTADFNQIGDSVLAEKHTEQIHQLEKDAEERIRMEGIEEMEVRDDNSVSVSSVNNISEENDVTISIIPESPPILTLTLEYPSNETDYSYFDSIM